MKQNVLQVPEFTGENVPIAVVARVMKKDAAFIRYAMQNGEIDLGVCMRMPNKLNYTYYISPKKLWELTGFIYRGEKE